MKLPLYLVNIIIDYLDNFTKFKFICAYKQSLLYFENIKLLKLYISQVDLLYIIKFIKNIEML